MKTSLVGNWVTIPEHGDRFFVGEITLSVGGQHHLVKLRPPTNGVPTFARLMSNDDLCADGVYIFETATALEHYLNWNEGKPRLVVMRQ